jgi:hypothetical protein
MNNVAHYEPVVHSYFDGPLYKLSTDEKIAICTLDYAKSLFFVVDGMVYWRHSRPRSHFKSDLRHQIWTTVLCR